MQKAFFAVVGPARTLAESVEGFEYKGEKPCRDKATDA
jgi:hypothetical protein